MSTNDYVQTEIARILDIQPELLIYEFKLDKNQKHRLELVTISPNAHRTRFLFHATTAETPGAALDAMFEYVNKHLKQQDTWQVRWHNPATKNVEVSWFRASNILEALQKFYHDKEIAEYKIYEVSLRPYA